MGVELERGRLLELIIEGLLSENAKLQRQIDELLKEKEVEPSPTQ